MRARSGKAWGWALAVHALALFAQITPVAAAEGKVPFLAKRLAYPPAPGQADDFRVRTSAALALGATNDDAAVTPLCTALSDPNDVVRHAAAVGLRRLARSASASCLSAHAAQEPNESVRTEIQRAIAAVDQAGASGGATEQQNGTSRVSNAKYYVALSHVANHTTRASTEVEQIVRGAIASQLEQSGKYQVASESSDANKAALPKGRLKGYFLATSVEKFDYSSEGLRVRVKIAVFSYPGKDLRGEVPTSGTLPGARPGDKDAENELLSALAGRAAELFAQTFQ